MLMCSDVTYVRDYGVCGTEYTHTFVCVYKCVSELHSLMAGDGAYHKIEGAVREGGGVMDWDGINDLMNNAVEIRLIKCRYPCCII